MSRKFVLLATKENEPTIVCGSFKKVCELLDVKYWTHSKNKLPMEIKEYKISKHKIEV